jgi:hypothetical protein
MDTIGDALPKEMERIRNLIPIYESLGPAGRFTITMMKLDLIEAERAIMEGDTVAMIQVYQSLKGFNS